MITITIQGTDLQQAFLSLLFGVMIYWTVKMALCSYQSFTGPYPSKGYGVAFAVVGIATAVMCWVCWHQLHM
jgi:hypothetical protein